MLKICVIDGQGGGIGSLIIKRLNEQYPEQVEICALGTNAIATAQMMKAGVKVGATGENAIIWNIKRADVVVGPIGIVLANAMLGEVSPAIAVAVASCRARKLLLAFNHEGIEIVGMDTQPLSQLVEQVVCQRIKAFIVD